MGWVRSRTDGGVTMKPTAYMYTCRNLGQVALLWPSQPAPTGIGWIEVKQMALYSADQVEALVTAAYLKGRQDEDGQGFNESEVNTVVQELFK